MEFRAFKRFAEIGTPLFLFTLVLLLSSCSESNNDAGTAPASTSESAIQPILETAYKATSVISSTGGTISTVAGNGTVITLTVPDGGLAEDTEISITPVSRIDDLPLTGGLGSAVQFEPEGLIFSPPAVLTLDLPFDVDTSDLIGFGWFDAGSNFYLQPTSTTGNQMTFLVPHFSGAGAASGDAESAKTPVDEILGIKLLETKYLPLIVAEEVALENMICGDVCEGEELGELQQAKIEFRISIFNEWRLALSSLAREASRSNVFLRATMLAFNSFRSRAAELAPDYLESNDVQTVLAEVLANILDGTIAQIQRINEAGCKDTHDAEILSLRREIAESFGAEEEFDALLQSRGISFSDFGCQLVIQVNGFPTEMIANGEIEMFSISLLHQSSGLPLDGVDGKILSGNPGTQCTLFNKFLNSSNPVRFTTSGSGRAPQDPSSEFEYAVGNCSASTSTVVIDVKSGSAASLNQQFIGKSLVLTAAITSDASFRLLPEDRVVMIGESLQLTAVAPEVENPTFTWEATGGSVDQQGLYTAGFVPGDFDVTVTIQETGAMLVGVITVEGTAISVSPSSTLLSPGERRQFSATVLGPTNTDVTWMAQGGLIDATGLYTAGNNPGQFFVTATSITDPSVTASAAVTIENQPETTTWLGTARCFDIDRLGPVRSSGIIVIQTGNELEIRFPRVDLDDGELPFTTPCISNNTLYTATLSGGGFSGSSGDDCFEPCTISGNLGSDTISGTAFWDFDCNCFTDFEATIANNCVVLSGGSNPPRMSCTP